MATVLDIKAHAIRKFFNFWGRLGGYVLNYGVTDALEITRDLPYGPDPMQRLDVLRPKHSISEALPVLVYFHGGGWISADKRIYDGICSVLSSYGWLIFNVNYRLAPEHRFPAPQQDAAKAIEWIRCNANRYGGDASRIVLGGDSAGAQIAAWYAEAMHDGSLRSAAAITDCLPSDHLRGLLLFYGVYDFDTVRQASFPFIGIYTRSFLGTDEHTYAGNVVLASPSRHVSTHLPPVFLCAGQRDGLYTQTVDFAALLQQSGIDCRTLLFPGTHRADHGFLFFRWLKSSKQAFVGVREFLRDL